jgi:hypothetical protein
MKKGNFELNKLGTLILVIILLLVVTVIIIASKEKSLGLIGQIGEILRFGL